MVGDARAHFHRPASVAVRDGVEHLGAHPGKRFTDGAGRTFRNLPPIVGAPVFSIFDRGVERSARGLQHAVDAVRNVAAHHGLRLAVGFFYHGAPRIRERISGDLPVRFLIRLEIGFERGAHFFRRHGAVSRQCVDAPYRLFRADKEDVPVSVEKHRRLCHFTPPQSCSKRRRGMVCPTRYGPARPRGGRNSPRRRSSRAHIPRREP